MKIIIFCRFILLALSREAVDAEDKLFVPLKILSFNLFQLPGQVTHNAARAKLAAQAIKTTFADHDILLIQEVYSDWISQDRQKFIQNAAHEVKFVHQVLGPPVNATHILDSGLIICSKHAITTSDVMLLKGTMWPDRFHRKGVVYARIWHAPSERHLHVFTTHPQATHGHMQSTIHSTKERRFEQLQQIGKYIRQSVLQYHDRSEGEPVILLGGDMNVDGLGKFHPGEYQRMLQVLNDTTGYVADDLLYSHWGNTPTFTPWGDSLQETRGLKGKSYNPSRRLDYLFLLRRRRKKEDEDVKMIRTMVYPMQVQGKPFRSISDHSAISATLEVSKSRKIKHEKSVPRKSGAMAIV